MQKTTHLLGLPLAGELDDAATVAAVGVRGVIATAGERVLQVLPGRVGVELRDPDAVLLAPLLLALALPLALVPLAVALAAISVAGGKMREEWREEMRRAV